MKTRTLLFGFNLRALIRLALAGALWLPVATTSRADGTDTNSYADRLGRVRKFDQPLLWIGDTPPNEDESEKLWQSISAFNHSPESFASLEAFLQAHTNSPWSPSLEANLAMHYRQNGYFTLALSNWESAWQATKNEPGMKERQVADYALVSRLNLLASLGRTDTMTELFTETKTRSLLPQFRALYIRAQSALEYMDKHPEKSYRCGTFALDAVSKILTGTNHYQQIGRLPSPVTGFSLAFLEKLAQTNHLDMVAVERPAGAEIVVPSVVHWKDNHYAAILEKKGDIYKVVDPTFLMTAWLRRDAIDAESSGHFLAPAKQVPSNWRKLAAAESSQIYGKGFPMLFPPSPNPPCVADSSSQCATCPPGGGGSGGNGGGAGSGGPPGGGSGGHFLAPSTCPTCNQNSPPVFVGELPKLQVAAGMPVWTVEEPYETFWIWDKPMGYQPAKGPRISFEICYNSSFDDPGIEPSGIFSLGLEKWRCSWFSYVDYRTPGSGSVTLYPRSGGSRIYDDLTGTTPEYHTQTRMLETDSSGHPVSFTLFYPDGAQDVYGFIQSDADRAFLTQQIDAAGRTINYLYDMAAYTNLDEVLLDYVVDADGKTNTLHYSTAPGYEVQITQVDDPYGNHMYLSYDGYYLTNVVDVVGNSSSFAYNTTSTVLTNLTTPYGSTSFDFTYYGLNQRSLLVTEPDNSHELYLYVGDSFDNTVFTNSLPKVYTDLTNVPTLAMRPDEDGSSYDELQNPDYTNPSADDYMQYGNSVYWNRAQFADLSAAFLATGATNWDVNYLTNSDFASGRLRHWLATDTEAQDDALGMQREPSPDGGTTPGKMTWYDYPGVTVPGDSGSSAFPSLKIMVMPDGNPWYEIYQRDQWGHVTNLISTYSSGSGIATRIYRFVYSTNRVDLLRVIGPDAVTNAAYGYNGNHQVTSMTNGVGEVTTYTYDGTTALFTSSTTAAGLVTTNIYDGDDRLVTNYSYAVSGGVITQYFGTNIYTWTNRLVLSQTDARGLTTTNTWDALERLLKVTYPDTNFVTNTYDKLDIVKVVDRMGFTNSYGFDNMRQLAAATNANGTVTRYGYCLCGALTYLTNAFGTSVQAVTQHVYDNQGNRILTIFPDGYCVTNLFDSVRRLTNTVDSGGVSITNWFNNQGLMFAQSNYFGQVFKSLFDIDDRTTNRVDANGVTVTASYDNLGRVLVRGYPDGGTEKFYYNTNGLVLYTNQLSQVTQYDYDAMLRKITETNANLEVTHYTNSPAGDLLALVDGKSQVTLWNYDIYGLVSNKVDNAANIVLTYHYDADQRLTTRNSIAKGDTYYYYDKVGNLTNVTYPVSPAISLAYDALSRLTNMIDGVGTTKYGYDAAGQLLSEDGPWADDTVSYAYANRLRTAMSLVEPNADSCGQTYAYDGARRLTNTISPAGSFAYQYNATCKLLTSKLLLPNGAFITNDYDGNARLLDTWLRNAGNVNLNTHSYTYNQGNQRTEQMFLKGNYQDYLYDKIGQLTNAAGKEPGGTTNRLQEQLSYGYDAAHNLSARTNNALVQTFNVNGLNELSTITRTGTLTVAGTTSSSATSVTVNGSSSALYEDYAFAKDGFTVTNGNNSYTAIAGDSLGRHDTNTITVNLPTTNGCSYDSNGNLTSDGMRGFDYDDENQLIRVMVTNAWKTEFTYDGKMRLRIRKEYGYIGSSYTATNEVYYIYDGNLVIQERNSMNLPVTSYTRGTDLSGSLQKAGGIGGMLAMSELSTINPQHFFYHCDGNGNITALVNAQQFIAARYEYDPYGNVLSQSGPLADANTYRFSSKEYLKNAGLVYYLYRFYEANLQRWLNRDPIEERGGINLYGYVWNNPINKDDPFGQGNPIMGLGGAWNSDPYGPPGDFYGPGYLYSPRHPSLCPCGYHWGLLPGNSGKPGINNSQAMDDWEMMNGGGVGWLIQVGVGSGLYFFNKPWAGPIGAALTGWEAGTAMGAFIDPANWGCIPNNPKGPSPPPSRPPSRPPPSQGDWPLQPIG